MLRPDRIRMLTRVAFEQIGTGVRGAGIVSDLSKIGLLLLFNPATWTLPVVALHWLIYLNAMQRGELRCG
jgi:hypothetical protein